jgi:hypothetical protein
MNNHNPNIWTVQAPGQVRTHNCAVPKYILTSALSSNDVKLPLIFKIVNIVTQQWVICAADEFLDTHDDEKVIQLSSVIQEYLGQPETVSIVLEKSAIRKAKMVIFEPQSELFYKLKDHQKTLEKCLKSIYILTVEYLIPIELKIKLKTKTEIKTIYMKIVKILDDDDESLTHADINNIDLNVDFLPLPENLKTPKPAKKPTLSPIQFISSSSSTSEVVLAPQEPPLYDNSKQWTPFCGWGHVLSSGQKIKGAPQ